jgi:hypothetical protein
MPGSYYNHNCNSGNLNYGTVFELSPATGDAWTENVGHSFGNGTDEGNPYAGLIFDAAGNLYGTTQLGGTYASGTVFE